MFLQYQKNESIIKLKYKDIDILWLYHVSNLKSLGQGVIKGRLGGAQLLDQAYTSVDLWLKRINL